MSVNAKLIVGVALICALTGYLGYLGASTSWRYYVLVDECLQDVDRLAGHRLRVSGTVAAGSLQINGDRSAATFGLAGQQGQLYVRCSGPLPDNLEEGIEVVVEGRLAENHELTGEKVLTRCASKYQAEPEAPQESGEMRDGEMRAGEMRAGDMRAGEMRDRA